MRFSTAIVISKRTSLSPHCPGINCGAVIFSLYLYDFNGLMVWVGSIEWLIGKNLFPEANETDVIMSAGEMVSTHYYDTVVLRRSLIQRSDKHCSYPGCDSQMSNLWGSIQGAIDPEIFHSDFKIFRFRSYGSSWPYLGLDQSGLSVKVAGPIRCGLLLSATSIFCLINAGLLPLDFSESLQLGSKLCRYCSGGGDKNDLFQPRVQDDFSFYCRLYGVALKSR